MRLILRRGIINSVTKTIKISNREALNKALDQALQQDPNVFIIGEEVAQYDGAYKITKGLLNKYGRQRIYDTPITQSGFTGLSIGASLMGLRPVVQFMTMNFALQAVDHIINSSAKLHHMSNGILSTPIVFRGLNGPAAHVAAQHSQCFAAMYSNIPGLIVISPYDAQDCKGLLTAAIRDPNPVVFLQNQILYGHQFTVPQQILKKDFELPIGKAKIMKQGNDISLIAHSRMVDICLQAASLFQKQNINCQVLNLRTIKPLDRQAIVNTVKKTGKVLLVEDGFPKGGVMAQVCATICQSGGFDYLDAPIKRLCGLDVPMPYSKSLQQVCTPRVNDVVRSVLQLLQKK